MRHSHDREDRHGWEEIQPLLESERAADRWEGAIRLLESYDGTTPGADLCSDGLWQQAAAYLTPQNRWRGQLWIQAIGNQILPVAADAAAHSDDPRHHRRLLECGHPRRIERLFRPDEGDYTIYGNLARNRHASAAIRLKLAEENVVPYELLGNPACEPEVIEVIFEKHTHWEYLTSLAHHPNTPPHILKRFTGWPASSARDSAEAALRQNPNLPWSVKVALQLGIRAHQLDQLGWDEEQQQLCVDLVEGGGWEGSFEQLVAVVKASGRAD